MGNSVEVGLGVRNAPFLRGMESAKRSAKGFTAAASKRIPNAFGLVGFPLTAAAAVAGLDAFIARYDRIGKLATTLDLGVEEIQKLSLVAETGGTNLETVARAASRLQRVMGEVESNSAIRKALKDLNIEVAEFEKLDAVGQLAGLADGLAGGADRSRSLAALNVLLGRSYQDLIPLMSQGSEAIAGVAARLGETNILSQEQVDVIQQVGDEWTILKANLAGLVGIPALEYMRQLLAIIVAFKQTLTEGGVGGAARFLLLGDNEKFLLNLADELEENTPHPRSKGGGFDPSDAEDLQARAAADAVLQERLVAAEEKHLAAKIKNENSEERATRLVRERLAAMRSLAQLEERNRFLGTSGPNDAAKALELRGRLEELSGELSRVSARLFSEEVSPVVGGASSTEIEDILKEEKAVQEQVLEEEVEQTRILRSLQDSGGSLGVTTFSN